MRSWSILTDHGCSVACRFERSRPRANAATRERGAREGICSREVQTWPLCQVVTVVKLRSIILKSSGYGGRASVAACNGLRKGNVDHPRALALSHAAAKGSTTPATIGRTPAPCCRRQHPRGPPVCSHCGLSSPPPGREDQPDAHPRILRCVAMSRRTAYRATVVGPAHARPMSTHSSATPNRTQSSFAREAPSDTRQMLRRRAATREREPTVVCFAVGACRAAWPRHGGDLHAPAGGGRR